MQQEQKSILDLPECSPWDLIATVEAIEVLPTKALKFTPITSVPNFNISRFGPNHTHQYFWVPFSLRCSPTHTHTLDFSVPHDEWVLHSKFCIICIQVNLPGFRSSTVYLPPGKQVHDLAINGQATVLTTWIHNL